MTFNLIFVIFFIICITRLQSFYHTAISAKTVDSFNKLYTLTSIFNDRSNLAHDKSIKPQREKVAILRKILHDSDSLTVMPCCYDGLTAKLVENAGMILCKSILVTI